MHDSNDGDDDDDDDDDGDNNNYEWKKCLLRTRCRSDPVWQISMPNILENEMPSQLPCSPTKKSKYNVSKIGNQVFKDAEDW